MSGQSALSLEESAHRRPLCRSGGGRGRMLFGICCTSFCLLHTLRPGLRSPLLLAGKRKANQGGRGGGSSGRGGANSPEGLSSRERVLKKMKMT